MLMNIGTQMLLNYWHSSKTKRKAKIVLNLPETIGISTGLIYKCKNGWNFNIPHKKVNWGDKKRNRESETFELNVTYIISLQQIECCCTKAELVMSFLNLPNGVGMKKVHIIE